MEELISTGIILHLFFIGIMILMACINLYFIFFIKEFSKFATKLNTLIPLYYSIIAIVFMTGLVLMGVNKMYLSIEVFFMIVILILILVMSIKIYKKYKLTLKSPNNIELQIGLRSFVKKKYILDILLLISFSLVIRLVG